MLMLGANYYFLLCYFINVLDIYYEITIIVICKSSSSLDSDSLSFFPQRAKQTAVPT